MEAMIKEMKCPFLEITKVGFCRGFPVKKMIPLHDFASGRGLCNSPGYEECSVYKEVSHSQKNLEEVRGFKLRLDYLYHPGHTWVLPGEDNLAKVGIDDFAQRLIGKIEKVTFLPVHSSVSENSVCLLLSSGKRMLKLMAPANGIVRDTNSIITTQPGLINIDPYNSGWIFSMELTGDGISGLFYGNTAKRWLRSEIERLLRIVNEETGITATDGGEPLFDIAGILPDSVWERVAKIFFG